MQTTKTTIHLSLPRARSWLDRMQIPPALIVAVSVFVAAGAIAGAGRLHSQGTPVAVPTSAPIIIFRQAPTSAPVAAPAPDMALRQEVEQLRARVAELEQQPQVVAAPIDADQPAAPESRQEAPVVPIVAEQPNHIDSAPAAPPTAPPAAPTAVPAAALTPNLPQPGAVERAWAQEAWREEHCNGGVCIP